MPRKRRKEIVISEEELQSWLEGFRPADEVIAEMKADPIDLWADPDFVGGCAKDAFVGDVFRAMKRLGINKNSLAQRLGKSRQYVGRILNETANFTVDTMAEIACALGMRLSVRMAFPDEAAIVQESTAPLPPAPRPAKRPAKRARKRPAPKPRPSVRLAKSKSKSKAGAAKGARR